MPKPHEHTPGGLSTLPAGTHAAPPGSAARPTCASDRAAATARATLLRYSDSLFLGSIGNAIIGLIVAIVVGVVGYYIWAYVTYFVGTNLFKGTADVGELLRTLGYASGPKLLGIFVFIPCVGALASLAGAIWSLVAGVIAVREALDFDTTKAVITVIIGWVIILLISLAIGAVLGVGAVGLGALSGATSGQ